MENDIMTVTTSFPVLQITLKMISLKFFGTDVRFLHFAQVM